MHGCAVAIACSSMATEMVLGKVVEEAYGLTEQAVADALGGIPAYRCVAAIWRRRRFGMP